MALLFCVARAAFGADVILPWQNTTTAPLVSNVTFLDVAHVGTNGHAITTTDRTRWTNDAAGQVIFTNLVVNTYIATVQGPYKATPIQFTVTNAVGTYYALDLNTTPTNTYPGVAYSTTVSDARYQFGNQNLSNLAGLSAGNIAFLQQLSRSNALNLTNLQASNLVGTIPVGALTAGATNTPGHLLVIAVDGAGHTNRYTTTNGSALTNLNASELRSGTLIDARLSANVPLKNGINIFSGASNTFNTDVWLNDPNGHLWLSVYGSLYLQDGHSGTAELGVHYPRIAIIPGEDNFGNATNGAIQFGASGGVIGYNPLFYTQTQGSTYLASNYILGYSYPWVDLYSAYNQPFAGNVSRRATAANTNGAGYYDFAYGTYVGILGPSATVNQGPLTNEALGILSTRIRVGTNIDDRAMVQYGPIIRDGTNVSLSGTNYGADFDGTAKVWITLSGAINITNVPLTFARTNQYSSIQFILIPGTSAYPLATPAVWLYASNATAALTIPTNVPASTKRVITVEADVDNSGVTNYFAKYSDFPYVPTYDTNAQNYFNATGGSLTTAETNAANSFAVSAKAHSYWANLRLFNPLFGATSNSCSWNLANTNKYRMKWVGTTSTNFTTLGVYGDGSAMYADPSFVPSTELASANSSMCGVWVRGPANPTPDPNWFYGCVGTSTSMRWGAARNGSNAGYDGMNWNGNQSGVLASSANFAGFIGQNRVSVSSESAYLNGVVGGSDSTAAVGLPNVGVVFFARNFQNSVPDHPSAVNLTCLVIAENMTAQNTADLIADTAALNTAVGR